MIIKKTKKGVKVIFDKDTLIDEKEYLYKMFFCKTIEIERLKSNWKKNDTVYVYQDINSNSTIDDFFEEMKNVLKFDLTKTLLF